MEGKNSGQTYIDAACDVCIFSVLYEMAKHRLLYDCHLPNTLQKVYACMYYYISYGVIFSDHLVFYMGFTKPLYKCTIPYLNFYL